MVKYIVYLEDSDVADLTALEEHLTKCMLEDENQRRGLRTLKSVLREIRAKEYVLD